MSENETQILKKERFEFIDRACGLAILLVVYGHIRFTETDGINWYFTSMTFVYKFHMPLFMCLSGYLAFLSANNKAIKSENDYLAFQKRKLLKFIPAYIFFGIVSIAMDAIYYNAPIDKIKVSIFYFFFSPGMGSAGYIWYLYVLFGFYLITPFVLNLKTDSQYLLLIFSFFLTDYLNFTALFSTNLFCKSLFFFLGGGLIFKNRREFMFFLRKNGKWILPLTLSICILDFFIELKIPYQLVSIGLILSILYVSNLTWPKILSKVFIAMGVSSFAIYLFNTSLIDLYYLFFTAIFEFEIGIMFIISCLVTSIVVSILIRVIFNRIIPSKVYSL